MRERPSNPKIPGNPTSWPQSPTSILTAHNVALIVIDMQRDFCDPQGYLHRQQGQDISSLRAIIPSIRRLIDGARASNLAVFHTREGHRPDLSDLPSRELARSRSHSGVGIGDAGPLGRVLVRGQAGHGFVPELYPVDGEAVIDKPGKGAFTFTDLDLLLKVRGIEFLILAGVTTDVCVHSTLREAVDRGYEGLLVEDCCAASDRMVHDAALRSVRGEGGVFGCTAGLEDVLEVVAKLGFD